MYKHLIGILLVVAFSTSLKSQKYYFEKYSVKEGLAQSKVQDVIQDEQGYVWLGTASGASRFNGNDFENFTADDGMAPNGVRTIYQDSKGIIWFGHSGGGISYYNGITFTRFKIDTLAIKGDITCFLEDVKGRFWIATQNSGAFAIFNHKNGMVDSTGYKHYTGKSKLNDRVFFITETSDKKLYFIIDQMIKIYDEENDTFVRHRHEGLSQYFQPTTMFEDKDKNLWYGTYQGGLYRQDYKTGNVTVFDQVRDGLANNWVSCINQDNKGDIWVGTWGGGISRINPNFLTFNQSNGLPDNKIWKITTDREGNILIGTHENGLCVFKGDHFVSFHSEDGLPSEQIDAIAEDNQNNIWIGTPKGLCKYNLSSNKIKTINLSQRNISSEIVSIKKDPKGKVWIATKEDGIYSYDPLSNSIHYNSRFNSMILRHGLVATSLEIDADGHVWVGTIGGLYYLEPENNASRSLLQGEISCLFYDSQDIMWIGTKGKGIVKVDGTTFNKPEALEEITSISITEDKEGSIWFGTEGQGIVVYTKDSTILKYKSNDGLLADLVTALTTDKEGNIWIGTNKGLNKYDVKDEKFYAFTERSGFTGIEVKNQALFHDYNGHIYCGTVKGLFKFTPQNNHINHLEPLTFITNFKVNLKSRPIESNIKLNYKEKTIFFEYHGICLSDPQRVRYQIMLEGADLDWLPPTEQTYKNYSPLPPGKYVFKVKACNNNGIWNSQAVEFPFTIKPPFYLTWWFLTIAIILVLVAVISYINIREKNLKKEKIILENKVKTRTAEVVKKNVELGKKNQDILDSINYAKRIQQAILPNDQLIKSHFPESFVLFKPKDIVSGDFYWFEALEKSVLFSAIDCTGHGVPGAFMSIMGHGGLQSAISEFELTRPHEILERLNDIVQSTLLSGDNKEIKDGMDMALCAFYPETNILEYSGANNPLYIVRSETNGPLIKDGEEIEPKMTNYGFNLFETKPNKQPIGPYIHKTPFDIHSFEMKKGDTVYIFSDGYPDQFGGPKGRKYMYKNFKDTILKNQEESMGKQKSYFNQIINAWMSNCEQIDDICVMGIKI